MPKEDYMAALAVSDIFLDTRYYDAHTTAADSIFGALPVLTVPDVSFSSRVALSLNSALELDSFLNLNSRKEYAETATHLCRHSLRLRRIRELIRDKIGIELYNSSRFRNKLEYAYQAVTDMRNTFRYYNLLVDRTIEHRSS